MKRFHRMKLALFLVGILVTFCSLGVEAKLGASKQEVTERRKLQRLTIVNAPNTGDPPPEALPLAVCFGDCDTDDDCAGSLICYQRGKWEEVPGCVGGRSDGSITDYCIVDPNGPRPTSSPTTATPTLKPTTATPTSAEPTPSPTISPAPTNKPTNKPTPVPTPQPTNSPTDKPSESPTYSSFGKLTYVGNEGTFYAPYPLGVCNGDCDVDEDCAEGLYCYQRNAFEDVPYCDGGARESSTADFCAWDGLGDPPEVPTPAPDGYFRLKLFWDEGYRWQNETFERDWCMMYDYTGYPGTGLCWYGDKDRNCDKDHLFMAKCVEDPRMWFTFVNVTSNTTSNPNTVHEYLIMTGDNQRCFERKNREVFLEWCEPNNAQQRFFALNGDFFGEKFEISQLGYTSQCVTNDHHPKSGEVVETHDCEDSRSEESQTSYWERLD